MARQFVGINVTRQLVCPTSLKCFACSSAGDLSRKFEKMCLQLKDSVTVYMQVNVKVRVTELFRKHFALCYCADSWSRADHGNQRDVTAEDCEDRGG